MIIDNPINTLLKLRTTRISEKEYGWFNKQKD